MISIQEEELSIKEVLGSVTLSGWLTDIKMVLSVFLPIYLNAGHGRIQAIDNHPWTVHKCSVLSQMIRLVCGYTQGWVLSQSYNFCLLYSLFLIKYSNLGKV